MKNKSFKWLRSLFLAIVLTTVTIMGLPLTGGPITALAADKDIVVLYTNDVHCGVDDNIGYAGLALYKKEMQQQTPYVTLVDTGDAIQGAPIGTLSDGGYLIDIMNYVGYDFEMCIRDRLLAESLGVELEFQNTDGAGRVPMIQSDKADVVIACLTATNERAKSVAFTDPYASGGIIGLCKSDHVLQSWDDLEGKKISVARGSINDCLLYTS